MRAEQHGDAQFLLQRARQFDDRPLMMRIEADQRFVEQQQARAAEQRLGQQQALTLAARGLRQRAPCKLGRLHPLERPRHRLARGAAEQRQAPAVAVDAAGDEVPAREPQLIQRAAHLRHVADGGIAARHRPAQHADRAVARRQQAQYRAHQRGLARAVGPEHADELVVADREVDAGKHRPGAERQRHIRRIRSTFTTAVSDSA